MKYLKKLPVVGSDHVAPLVGAWIEIETAAGGGTIVAPLVGAWIEMGSGVSAYI